MTRAHRPRQALIDGGGHTWFGDPTCGPGAGDSGCGIVGADSDYYVNTDMARELFKRLSR